jgi:hypothetical protein
LRSRVEVLWYASNLAAKKETGFLFFTDVHFKPAFTRFSFNGRIQYVETGGYNSRIYAWENTVLYNFSIPAFYDKSFRYVATMNYRLGHGGKRQKNMNCLLSASFGQSLHPFTANGAGAGDTSDYHTSSWKLQVIISVR